MTSRAVAIAITSVVTTFVGSNFVVIARALHRGDPPRRAMASASVEEPLRPHRSSMAEGLLGPPVTALGTPRAPETSFYEAPYRAPACPGIRVAAVAVASEPSASIVTLEGAGGARATLRQRDRFGERAVWWIAADRVWLADAAGLCQASGEAAPVVTPVAPSSSAPPASHPLVSRIERRGEGDYVVDRNTLDALIEQGPSLARGVRTAFEQENGATVGVRLSGLRPEDPLSAIGLANGDRLERVAGVAITGPDRALEAYARVRSVERVSFVVRRGDALHTIDVTIR